MTEAVVLARHSFKEWDEMISLYSKSLGKIELTVRGTKKIVSKNSPFLEPFSCIDVGIVPGKERQYITTTQSIEYFSNIRKEREKALQAGFLMSLLDAVLKPMEKNADMYDTILSWLHFLDEIPNTKTVLLDAVLLKLVSFLGFEPQLLDCTHCGKELGQEKMYFSFSSGGVLCHKDKIEKREENTVPLTTSTLLALRYILSRSWREIVAFVTPELERETHKIIYPYIVYSTEKQFRDYGL